MKRQRRWERTHRFWGRGRVLGEGGEIERIEQLIWRSFYPPPAVLQLQQMNVVLSYTSFCLKILAGVMSSHTTKLLSRCAHPPTNQQQVVCLVWFRSDSSEPPPNHVWPSRSHTSAEQAASQPAPSGESTGKFL